MRVVYQPLPVMPDGCMIHVPIGLGASEITDDLITVGSRGFHQLWIHGIDRLAGTN